ncbi:MAG: PH domain-containing protein [Oscillospiraceae bacterium]|nr:PH domain-containing protein [Oscillospiraceae bacterium]
MSKKNAFEYIWRDRKRTIFGLPWSFTTYFLTETKFVTRSGFLSLAEDELDLYKVTDKKLLLPFWQRIVGCGTIIIYVRDTDTPQKEIRCVKKPREVLKMLDKQIDKERDRYNTRGRDLYAAMGGMGHPPMYHDHDAADACDDYADHHDGHF